MKKTKRKGGAKASGRGPAKETAKAPAKETAPTLKSRVKNLEGLKIPYIIALCVLVFLGWWRTSTRPLSAILGTDRFTAVSASLLRETDTGDQASLRLWQLNPEPSDGDGDTAALLEILDSTRYRPDLGDLWLLQGGAAAAGPVSVTLHLAREDGETRTVEFADAKTMRAAGKRFHPVDRTVLDRLAAYVEEHGEEASLTGGPAASSGTDSAQPPA